MSFAFPQALFALALLVPVVIALTRSARRTRETAAVFHGDAPGPAWFAVRLASAVLFVASLAVVAARPYVAFDRTADFLFVVDVSRSMQARYSCAEPTFLERAKAALRETAAALPEARIGIVAFDRFAFPVAQLTSDRAYLEEVIEHGLYVGLMLEATQTEIANALSVIAAKKDRLPEIYGNVEHVVLFSDGHVGGSFRRRLQAPLAELRNANVRVATVGVGNPAPTPIADSEGGQCIARHVETNGDTVMIPLRADILKFIATESGGGYYAETEAGRLAANLRTELGRRAEADTGAGPRRDISIAFIAIATLALLVYHYLPASLPGLFRLRHAGGRATG